MIPSGSVPSGWTTLRHERTIQEELKAAQRVYSVICQCQPKPRQLKLARKLQEQLGHCTAKAEQVQSDFGVAMDLYLTALETLYGFCWKGSDHLQAINEEIWQWIRQTYCNDSTPYRVAGLIYYKIRSTHLPRLNLSESRTLTKANLTRIEEIYPPMFDHIGWLLQLAPLFVHQAERFGFFSDRYRQACVSLNQVLDAQKQCWQLYEQRKPVFNDLKRVVTKVKQQGTYQDFLSQRLTDQVASPVQAELIDQSFF
jgi:hypothetical protein